MNTAAVAVPPWLPASTEPAAAASPYLVQLLMRFHIFVAEPEYCLALPHMDCPCVQYGWGVAAIITPTVLLITGVAFFGLVLGSGPLTPTLASIGLTPLMAAVLVRQ